MFRVAREQQPAPPKIRSMVKFRIDCEWRGIVFQQTDSPIAANPIAFAGRLQNVWPAT